MSENQKKILQMLAEGKINVNEAQRLLGLVNSTDERGNDSGNADTGSKSLPRFLHVIVEPKSTASDGGGWHHGKAHKVNVRVPFGLIRAGMKLATLIPSDTAEHVDKAFKEKGINFDIRRIKDEDLQDLITALQENEIDVESDNERIRLYAE
jgi:hypothetical protein